MSTTKKLAIGCIGLVVVGIGCSVLASGAGLWGVAQVGNEMANASATEAAAPGGSRESAVDLNADVKVGDLVYTVTEARSETTLTDDNGIYEPKTAQGKYVIVHYTVRNEGKEMRSVWGLELVDDQGRSFQETTMIGFVPDDEECIFTTMNPGLSETCTKIFEVPADAAGLVFHISGLLDGDAFVNTGQ
jgi:hypothetical protein